MASATLDPRMTSVKPRIRYNTIGGINGPLVVLDHVCPSLSCACFLQAGEALLVDYLC
jgi:hypothetical protein